MAAGVLVSAALMDSAIITMHICDAIIHFTMRLDEGSIVNAGERNRLPWV